MSALSSLLVLRLLRGICSSYTLPAHLTGWVCDFLPTSMGVVENLSSNHPHFRIGFNSIYIGSCIPY